MAWIWSGRCWWWQKGLALAKCPPLSQVTVLKHKRDTFLQMAVSFEVHPCIYFLTFVNILLQAPPPFFKQCMMFKSKFLMDCLACKYFNKQTELKLFNYLIQFIKVFLIKNVFTQWCCDIQIQWFSRIFMFVSLFCGNLNLFLFWQANKLWSSFISHMHVWGCYKIAALSTVEHWAVFYIVTVLNKAHEWQKLATTLKCKFSF